MKKLFAMMILACGVLFATSPADSLDYTTDEANTLLAKADEDLSFDEVIQYITDLNNLVLQNATNVEVLQAEIVRLDTRIDSLLANIGNISPPTPVAPVLDSVVAQDTATLRAYYTETGSLDSIVVFYTIYLSGGPFNYSISTDSGNTYVDIGGLATETVYQVYLKSKKGELYSGQSNTITASTEAAPGGSSPGGGVEGADNHFVNLNGSGLGDGSYGTEANPYANAIAASDVGATFWNSVGTNDTVYVDGGADSVTYTSIHWTPPAGKDNYTITKGISDGHSGKVIFDGNGHSTSGAIYLDGSPGIDGVTISRMTFREYAGATISFDGANGYVRNCKADSLEIISHNNYGIYWQGENNSTDYLLSYHNEVTNSKILGNSQRYSQTDGVYAQYMSSIRVSHNILRAICDEPSGTNRHSDPLQTYYVDTVFIDNNLVGWDGPYITGGSQMLFTENSYASAGQNAFHIWYNNVMYHNTPNSETVCMKGNVTSGGSNDVTMVVAHNTVYSKREPSGRFGQGGAGGIDSCFIDNNLAVVLDAYHNQNMNVVSGWGQANYTILYDLDGGITNLSGISGTGNTEATVILTDVTVDPSNAWDNYWTPQFDLSISSGAAAQNLNNDLESFIEGISWWGTPLSYNTIDGSSRDSTPDAGAY